VGAARTLTSGLRRWLAITHRGFAGTCQQAYELHRDEVGGSYSICLLLVLPTYTMMIGLLIQTALLLFAKLNTDYAAYVAGRSASVWLTNDSHADLSARQIRRAAVNALLPAASSDPRHLASSPRLDADAESALLAAFAQFNGGKGPTDVYLRRKRQYAEQATKVTYSVDRTGLTSVVRVQVLFDAPIQIPGLGRFLGSKKPGASFFTQTIRSESTAVLNETFRDGSIGHSGRMGIRYGDMH
jgi:hypothetical protein